MDNNEDKETVQHKQFYEEFLKYTTFTAGIIIVIVALMAIFLV